MSVYTSVYALDSKIKAPEIGDNGCIGFPPVGTDGETHDFLRIYRGLGQIGLITREMARFHAFLEAYGDEHLYFFVENDEGADAQRLDKILEEFDREGKRIPVFKLEKEEDFTRAKYKISSGSNHYVSRHADYFLNTDSFSVEKESLSKLTGDVFEADDWETAFYRVWGILDPYDGDLGNIREFVLGNPGPFSVEFLTGESAEKTTASEVDSEEAKAVHTARDAVRDTGTAPPADKRSRLIKIRDTIILLFMAWIVIRILYHGFQWLTG